MSQYLQNLLFFWPARFQPSTIKFDRRNSHYVHWWASVYRPYSPEGPVTRQFQYCIWCNRKSTRCEISRLCFRAETPCKILFYFDSRTVMQIKDTYHQDIWYAYCYNFIICSRFKFVEAIIAGLHFKPNCLSIPSWKFYNKYIVFCSASLF